MWQYDDSSLYHFGIFGMKWGLRRYRNKDGTLTEEGKKRYYRNLKPETASDEDLKAAIERLSLEKKYRDIVKDLRPKKKRALDGILQELMKYAVSQSGRALVDKMVKNGKGGKSDD